MDAGATPPGPERGPARRHLEGANLRGVRILGWSGVVLMAVAAVVWLLLGGRTEFVAGRDPGWKAVVAGLAFGLAWAVWFAAALWFLFLMAGSIVNRLDGSYIARGRSRGRDRRRK